MEHHQHHAPGKQQQPHALSSQETYNPNHLLDTLREKMKLKNDAALLIRMHEVTQMSIRDLRDLMGDRRTKYRLSDAQGKPKPVIEPQQENQ